jgi:hypothetical protein
MRFVFLLTLVLVGSCKAPAPSSPTQLLNVDSLLDAQLKVVQASTIEKTIRVNDSTFRSVETSPALKKEFLAFRELGLMSRPIYRNTYQLTVQPDTQSNLTVMAWTANEEAPVKSLKLFYLNKLDRLKRLEAKLSTTELYTQSNKTLLLEFSILGDTVRLETYSISGRQRYFWGAPQYFSVDAVIRR